MINIAIIPARAGSKRLPKKNILPLGGKPLVCRVIECCVSSDVFTQVIVSTEDDEIKTLAQNSGATVLLRPESLSKDHSTVVEVCEHILKKVDCDNFCCVYATASLLSPKTIQKSAQIFLENKQASTLMGVSKYNFPPVQALEVDGNGFAKMLLPSFMKVKSQFHPITRVSNGTLYWGRKSLFLEELTFYSKKLKTFDIPDNEVCDIDTQEDYDRLLQLFNNN